MIRVLQIVDSMNRGGLETFIMNMYRNIDRKYIQFDFIVQSQEECDYDKEIYKLGGKIYRLPKRNKDIIGYISELRKILIENPHYKVAHIHTDGATSIIDTFTLLSCGVKTRIVHSHNTNTKRRLLSKLIRPLLNVSCTHKFACSLDAGKWLFGEKNINKNKVNIVFNGIDISKFRDSAYTRSEMRAKLGLENKLVLGHIGRFSEQKNHEFIIDIFKYIKLKNNQAELILVGDGELKNRIIQKVQKLGLEKSVRFLGVRDNIPELLHAMDIFLFPSLYEGLPLTLIEAQVANKKIVMSDVITKEVILSNNIRSISLEKNAEFWSEEILKFYDEENNIENKSFEAFDIKNIIGKIIQLYMLNSNKVIIEDK